MKLPTADMVLRDFKAAQTNKVQWSELYSEGYRYFSPKRDNFWEENHSNPGTNRDAGEYLFDSTGQDSLSKFVSNIQSSLTPPFKKFTKLEPGPLVEQKTEIGRQADQITDLVFSYLQASNFDVQATESYYDLAMGTGALLFQKGDRARPFRFVSVPLSELYITNSGQGRVDKVFRLTKMKAEAIPKLWPNAEIDTETQEKIDQGSDKDIEIIEATIPAKIERYNPETKKTVKSDGYKYVVMCKESKHIFVEADERSSPWIIFRWSVMPGEVFGRGPALSALPDVKTLNKVKELLLKAASIDIAGIWTAVDDGVINFENIAFRPGTIIPVASNGGATGSSIAPLKTQADVNLSQIIIQDLRNSINSMMFADPLGPIDLPVKSATEVALRQQELAKRIGSSFGRLQFELIEPLFTRAIDILDEFGLIEAEEFKVDGGFISLRPTSPIALAQDDEDFLRIQRYMETVAALYGPEFLTAILPPDKFAKEVGPLLNIPDNLIPTEQELKALQERAAQLAQAQQQPPQQ